MWFTLNSSICQLYFTKADCKEIQPVHPKGDQSWMFIARTDAKAETPILWPPRAKSWLIGKDPEAGKDWGQEEKGTTENEIAGWHHQLDGREFEWTPGGDGQGGLVCLPDMTERLNWTELNWKVKVKSFSCILLFETPWTVAYQAPPSMGFSRQEYWSGLPFPSPLNHYLGERLSLNRFIGTWPIGKPQISIYHAKSLKHRGLFVTAASLHISIY